MLDSQTTPPATAVRTLAAESPPPTVAVVIPSYRVKAHILPLLGRIGPEVRHIYVVDDACPEGSGDHVLAECRDQRVVVLHHRENQGVGGAVMSGYRQALADGADIVIKLDGDGQMDPALVPQFVAPIAGRYADYAKGNRFFNLEDLQSMPAARLLGNAVLSFMAKASTGYWNMFDPTNGYTAISARVLAALPLHKIQRRYFFETDMLFRLGTLQACVADLPMTARYADEVSGLRIGRILMPFLAGHLRNTAKRVFYGYFLRGFSIASLQLLAGIMLLLFGVIWGLHGWAESAASERPATTGTVMLAALPVLLGIQFLLSFLSFDMGAVPQRVVGPFLPKRGGRPEPLIPLRAVARCGGDPAVATVEPRP